MTATEFCLPDVGEGLTEAEIVTWHVVVGDVVKVNDTLVEIETAKSIVELPSPAAGVVEAVHIDEGVTVGVGTLLVTIGGNPTANPQEEPLVLVGTGPTEAVGRRYRIQRPTNGPGHSPGGARSETAEGKRVNAMPPVRKFAKDLGLDLSTLTGTGPGGTVTRADVLGASAVPPETVPFESTGVADIRIPIKGVRKHTAAAMVVSAFTAPHVTEFVTFDISATMELRAELTRRPEFADIKLSPLCFIAKAFLRAMERTPSANSRWDESAQEIIQMSEINLGIAAATPRGLVVPNIKGAQGLSLAQLSTRIADLTSTARAGKTARSDMSNGTVTITNFGVFGVDTGTPILNPGEAAILGVGAIRRSPWVIGERSDERIEARWVTNLALSFDHRVMDGQQGSELLADTAAFLRRPELAVL